MALCRKAGSAYAGRVREMILLLMVTMPLLAGCAITRDTEQVRICRQVIPALHGDGAELREMQAVTPAPAAVRIVYVARERGEADAPHWVACRFAGGTFEPGRLDLTAVESDAGPLGIARLLYLKRYWLSDSASRPGLPPPIIAHVPPAVASLFQQTLSAIPPCAIYALLATAYSLIYGLMGRINLAFGQIAVTGAFGAVAAVGLAVAGGVATPLLVLALALVLAAALAALWSAAVGLAIVAPLHARHRLGQPILVATIGAALALEEFLRLTQGARERWMPGLLNEPVSLAASGPYIVTATPMQFAVALVALACAAAVLLVLAHSRFGRQWRAFADDPLAAALMGVSPGRLLAGTFCVAGALAGVAGWIVAVYYGNVGFAMGTGLGLKALVAAVVGGIGSVPGAFLGGVLIGAIEAVWSAHFDIVMRDLVVYAVLIAVFVLRPAGLLGTADASERYRA